MYLNGIRDVFHQNSIEKSPSALEFFVPQQTIFSPLNYPLIGWWNFGDNNSVTYDANGISKVNDLSGNNFHLQQTTDANKPAYMEVNGVHVARFDGTNDWMDVAFGTTFNQPNTIFIIWKISGSTGNNQFSLDGIADGVRHIVSWGIGNTINIYAGTNVSYSKTIPFDYQLNTAIYNGASSQNYENGVSKVTGNANTNPLTGLTIGDGRGVKPIVPLKGDIAEIIAVNELLTDTDRGLFERYLYAKVLRLIG